MEAWFSDWDDSHLSSSFFWKILWSKSMSEQPVLICYKLASGFLHCSDKRWIPRFRIRSNWTASWWHCYLNFYFDRNSEHSEANKNKEPIDVPTVFCYQLQLLWFCWLIHTRKVELVALGHEINENIRLVELAGYLTFCFGISYVFNSKTCIAN
jgi:hypothetical protein